jgi:protein-S-isoprenylcysteine O-methyltransferase Ste14
VKALTTRHWSDWIGTAAFVALGVLLWRRAPEFGVLVLPAILQELLVVVSFLVRGRARMGAPSWDARAIAYANSFVILAFIWVASRAHPDWLRPTGDPTVRLVGSLLWATGALLSLWPLWYLRRSFSLEPEARHLVITGPYRLARHPIYTVYLLINAGILLRHLTVPFALVLAVWFVTLLLRIRYEEGVLSAAFPEYPEYRRRVRAFGVVG